jgi:hypothetical protein
MKRNAVISDCGRYRYRLQRVWEPGRAFPLFVMLNPSTADAEVDDATIRSCVRLSKSWGYGGIEVVNLFAWRATDPADLMKAASPVGPLNDEYIRDALAYCDFALCAWGAHKLAVRRGQTVAGIVRDSKEFAHCLGTTKAGAPKHPLYIKTGTRPMLYRGRP